MRDQNHKVYDRMLRSKSLLSLYYILCPPTDDLSLFKRNMANYSIRKKKQKQLLVTCLNSFLSQLLDYSISSKIKWHSQVLFMFSQSVPFSNFEKGLTNKYNKLNIHYLLTFWRENMICINEWPSELYLTFQWNGYVWIRLERLQKVFWLAYFVTRFTHVKKTPCKSTFLLKI